MARIATEAVISDFLPIRDDRSEVGFEFKAHAPKAPKAGAKADEAEVSGGNTPPAAK